MNYIKAAISVLVVAVVAVAVILPIFSAAEQNTYTKYNAPVDSPAPYAQYIAADSTETYTLTWNAAGSQTINGVDVALTKYQTLVYAIDGSYCLTVNTQGNPNWLGGTAMLNTGYTLTIAEGTATVTDSSDVIKGTFAWPGGYVRVATKTDYIFAAPDSLKYLTVGDTYTWAGLAWTTNNVPVVITVNATAGADDELNVTVGGGASDVTASIDSEETNGYYTFNAVRIGFTVNDTDYSATFSTVVVPVSVDSADKDMTVVTIIQILPVIILVGVLVLTVGTLIRNRAA